MARELRPRKSRINYAHILQPDSDTHAAGPSTTLPTDCISDQEFNPAGDEDCRATDEDEQLKFDSPGVDGNYDPEHDYAESASRVNLGLAGRKKSTRKLAVAPSRHKMTVTLAPGLSRPVNRQNYALPNPSSEHRHRAHPLYRHSNRVERLTIVPSSCGPTHTIPTNNWTFDADVTERINRVCGYNVGGGPVWQYMEDRSWWKESIMHGGDEAQEINRRPRVYEWLSVKDGWNLLDIDAAASYLPSDDEFSSQIASPIFCHFGPATSQTGKELKMFETFNMSELIPESTANIFNAGGPVWGLDWCPIYADDRPHRQYKQYIAVAPFPSKAHSPNIGEKCVTPFRACIQIWCLGQNPEETNIRGNLHDVPISLETPSSKLHRMHCELVVCIDRGPAHEIKWCPLPSNDSWAGRSTLPVRKLGVLAGAFGDGSLSIYVVPDPHDLAKIEGEPPVFVQIAPSLRFELDDTACWNLDWANSEVLVVGCTNGSIAVFNIKDALTCRSDTALLPTHYIPVHQAAVRSVQWIRAPGVSADGIPEISRDPVMVFSGGYDGCEIVTDLREYSGNVVNRMRDVINSVTYSTHAVGPISADHENIVKVFSIAPNMLGRGHALLEPGGPIWSLHCSDYHGQLAVGAADGTCMTTNILRSTRRSGLVPFFAFKVFQLDYCRRTSEFRMLEQFLPQETQDRPAATRAKRKAAPGADQSTVVKAVGTGVWPSEVGVQRVAWNTGGGLVGAPLLASATGCGLCRIDWMIGRTLNDREPYGGIEVVRKEVDSKIYKDSDDDDLE